jgi:transcriptional regulator with GAF, ATPase, and Fis domain
MMSELRAVHRTEEANLVRATLALNGWRLFAAARELGVSPSTLQKLIVRLGLDAEYRAHAPGKPGRPRKVKP